MYAIHLLVELFVLCEFTDTSSEVSAFIFSLILSKRKVARIDEDKLFLRRCGLLTSVCEFPLFPSMIDGFDDARFSEELLFK